MMKISIPSSAIEYHVCRFYEKTEDIEESSDRLYQNYSELWNLVLDSILYMRKQEIIAHMVKYFGLLMGERAYNQGFEKHKIIVEEYDIDDGVPEDCLEFHDKEISEETRTKYFDILNDFLIQKRHTNWEYVSQSTDISIIKDHLENIHRTQ